MTAGVQKEMYFFNIKTCVMALTPSGTNPEMKHFRWPTVLFIINTIMVTACLVITTFGLILKDHITTREILQSLEGPISFCHIMIKISSMFLNRSAIHKLIKSTLTFWKTEDLKYESDQKELSIMLKYIKYVCVAYIVSAILVNAGFTIKVFITKKKEMVFKGYVPEDQMLYNLLLYCECHVQVFLIPGVASFDILCLTFILMTFSQLKMFNRGIERVLSVDITSREERRAAKQTMRKYIEHHIFILNFLGEVVKTYSTVLLQVILIWIFTCCIEIFNVTRSTSLSDATPYLLYIIMLNFQVVVCYCIPCQLLINEIENTRACILNSDWNKNFMLFKTEILMLLAISSRSKVIVAGKFVEFSMSLFISAFKTMVSYYMFAVKVSDI